MAKVIEKAISGIRKAWRYFDGKKRNLGVAAIIGLRGVTLFFPDMLTMEQADFIRVGIDAFLLGGTAHAIKRYMKK